MKLISLNIWGGRLFEPLRAFVKDYVSKVDLFCFQEVLSTSSNVEVSSGFRANIYQEFSQVLSDFYGFFAPCMKDHDFKRKVDFDLQVGLAIFVKKTLTIKAHADVMIFQDRFGDPGEDFKHTPKNLQMINFNQRNKDFFLGNFHGQWYPGDKLDTDQRLDQSKKIKQFMDSKLGAKILVGDFNLQPQTKSLKILTSGMRNLIKEYHIPTTRLKKYSPDQNFADYILVSPNVNVIDFKVLDVEVSDHLPMTLEFDNLNKII